MATTQEYIPLLSEIKILEGSKTPQHRLESLLTKWVWYTSGDGQRVPFREDPIESIVTEFVAATGLHPHADMLRVDSTMEIPVVEVIETIEVVETIETIETTSPPLPEGNGILITKSREELDELSLEERKLYWQNFKDLSTEVDPVEISVEDWMPKGFRKTKLGQRYALLQVKEAELRAEFDCDEDYAVIIYRSSSNLLTSLEEVGVFDVGFEVDLWRVNLILKIPWRMRSHWLADCEVTALRTGTRIDNLN